MIGGDLDQTANGAVVTNWYVNPDDSVGATFLLTAASAGGDATVGTGDDQVAAASFTDSGGAYSINFAAADPDFYIPVIPFPESVTAIGGRGDGDSEIPSAWFEHPSTNAVVRVESLAPEDMALHPIVPFEIKITVDGSTAPEGGVITFTAGWNIDTTIEDRCKAISQWSFIDLYRKGLVYRREAPALWCPECKISIAQADLDDLDRQTEFITLEFVLEDGRSLPIATTRPELLPACVVIFVHPDDTRYQELVGEYAIVPIFEQRVPILADLGADQEKGSGAVMCCTFGDASDVAWWMHHKLPLVEVIDSSPDMVENCRSRGVATAPAMVSGLAPGRFARTWRCNPGTARVLWK